MLLRRKSKKDKKKSPQELLADLDKVHEADIKSDEAAKRFDEQWAKHLEERVAKLETDVYARRVRKE